MLREQIYARVYAVCIVTSCLGIPIFNWYTDSKLNQEGIVQFSQFETKFHSIQNLEFFKSVKRLKSYTGGILVQIQIYISMNLVLSDQIGYLN